MSRFNPSSAIVLAIVLAIAACEKSEPPPIPPEPIPAPVPTPTLDAGTLPISACYTIVVRIDRDGTWIGAPADVRCHAPFKSGAPDSEWITRTTQQLRTQIGVTCSPTVELGAVAGITYAQIVSVFAAVRIGGLHKLDFVDPSALAMTFDPAQNHTSTNCTGPLDTNKKARKPKLKRPPPPPGLPAPNSDPDYIAPVKRLTISRDAIFLDEDKLVARLADLPSSGTGPLAIVAAKLGPATADSYSIVVSPEASIDAALLHRIVDTIKNANYDHIWFETAP